jgi:hypothetical protein
MINRGLKMKKIIGICLTLIFMLTGCSNAKKCVDNTSKPNANDTTNENAALSSNQQSQSQLKDTPTNIKDINFKLLESIDTTKSQFEKGYYEYNGTINNNIPIRMSIYPLEKDIVGTYYYENQRNVMNLKGKAGEKNIILYEYDETCKNTGIFQGIMSTVEKIEGTWISADNKISYPFALLLEGGIPGAEYGKRYAMFVNNKSDQDVENFVSKIQSYIVSNKKEQLAEEIRYPINVKISNDVIKIQNKDDLIKNYDKIFTVDYKQAISKARTRELFANYQGIMFGDLGQIWINDRTLAGDNSSKLMIIAINN